MTNDKANEISGGRERSPAFRPAVIRYRYRYRQGCLSGEKCVRDQDPTTAKELGERQSF